MTKLGEITGIIDAQMKRAAPMSSDWNSKEIARLILKSLSRLPEKILEAGCAAHPAKPYGIETQLSDIVLAEHQAIIEAILQEEA
jgi:hypothetical protein